MKETLKKLDTFGIAIMAAVLISYSVRMVWSTYHTIAVALGAVLVVVALAAKSLEKQFLALGAAKPTARSGITCHAFPLSSCEPCGACNHCAGSA